MGIRRGYWYVPLKLSVLFFGFCFCSRLLTRRGKDLPRIRRRDALEVKCERGLTAKASELIDTMESIVRYPRAQYVLRICGLPFAAGREFSEFAGTAVQVSSSRGDDIYGAIICRGYWPCLSNHLGTRRRDNTGKIAVARIMMQLLLTFFFLPHVLPELDCEQ